MLKPFEVERGRFLEARVLTCGLEAFAVQSSRLGKSPVTFVPRGRGKRPLCLFEGVLGAAASVLGDPIPFTIYLYQIISSYQFYIYIMPRR